MWVEQISENKYNPTLSYRKTPMSEIGLELAL